MRRTSLRFTWLFKRTKYLLF